MKHCPTCHCDQPEKETRYHLSQMNVTALLKFAKARQILGKQDIHARREMFSVQGDCPFRLTYDELNNLSFLRQHALLVHADPEHPRSGVWRMTERAWDFILGREAIPSVAIGVNGHPVRREGNMIHIADYKELLPAIYELREAYGKPKVAETANLFS